MIITTKFNIGDIVLYKVPIESDYSELKIHEIKIEVSKKGNISIFYICGNYNFKLRETSLISKK